MAYSADKKPGELTALITLATDDVFVVGDTSDASEVAKAITKANLITDLGSSFAPVLGADDNYVTDAEKAALHAAVTVTDSTEIDFTLTGQDITASLKAGSIDETKLDTSVNASLDLADSALQAAAIGTTVQAYDAQLADIAALAVTDGNVIVGNGTNWVAESGATARTSLGVGTGDSPEFTAVNVGHASDTTITRVSAGLIAVEGSNLIRASDVDDTPVNGETAVPVSSNWAFDHEADTSTHGVTTVAGISETQTFTNKRITKRTGTTTSSATPTLNTDVIDQYYITAQTEAITSFTTNLSGTPVKGDTLFISIIGTAARAVTFGASFANGPVALPTTTITTAELSVLFRWDGSVWRCMASGSTV